MEDCGHEESIKNALMVFELTRPALNDFLEEHFGPGKYDYRAIAQPMFDSGDTPGRDREDYLVAATIIKYMGSGEGLVIGVIEQDIILYIDEESSSDYSHEVYATIFAEDTQRRLKLWVPFLGQDKIAAIIEIGDLQTFIQPDDESYIEACDQLKEEYPETTEDFLTEPEDDE